MKKNQFLLLLTVMFLGGIIGGSLPNLWFNNAVYAVNKATPTIVKASEFIVIGDNGEVICTLGQSGLSFVMKIDKDIANKVELNGFGLNIQQENPGYWRHERTETKISPYGLTYKAYSKKEKERVDKLPFDFSENFNIKIGDSNSSTPGPAITLSDSKYNERMIIGSTDLHIPKSDSTMSRPTASIVMFNDKGSVVWDAPRDK